MTTDPPFDPTAPLAGPPEPWESAPTPSRRSGPPYHMTDMIAAEPALAGRILDRLADPGGPAATLAAAVRATVEAGDPVIVTGCGTSEHGALAVAAILREAARAGRPGDRLDLGGAGLRALAGAAGPRSRHRHHPRGRRRPPPTRPSRRRDRPARTTAVITVSRRSPAGALATIVVETDELDHGWCHTVGYLSPILAGAAVGAHLSGRPLDGATVTRLLADGARDETGADGDRGGPRRCGAAPRRRVGIGPPRRPRARAQGRGGVVAAVGLPRPRDVPPRPPARDRTDDGARPGPHRSRPRAPSGWRAPGRPSPRRG